MYKNFNLTDEERKEIMEQHKSHGYKKQINEQPTKENKVVSCSSLGIKTIGYCDVQLKKPVKPCSELGVKTIGYCYVDTKKPINEQPINEMVLVEQQLGFISMFPTADTLTTKTRAGYNPIGGTNNTNVIYLTRRDEKTGTEIPNSKFSYKLSGSYGFINFDITLRNISRNPATGELLGHVLPKNNTVASIMKKLIPNKSLTPDGWLSIRVPVDKLNAALVQLHNNKGSSAEIKVGSGIEINLTKIA